LAVRQQGLLSIDSQIVGLFFTFDTFETSDTCDTFHLVANLSQIRQYLQKNKIKYKVSDLGGEVYKVEDVIKVGVNPDQILKTLIITSTVKEGLEFKDKYFALVLKGKDRVDFKKVRRIFGGKSELARADEVQKVAGVSVGAVCPILLDIPIYIDENAMNLKQVNMGSGDLTKELEMDFKDLLNAIGEYEVVNLS